MSHRSLIAGLILAASAACAQDSDGIWAETLLDDEAFFRLATCGAPPGGACTSDAPRWGKPVLTLAFRSGITDLPAGFQIRIDRAITAALAEINGAGVGITIRRRDAGPADITISPTDLPEGTDMAKVPGSEASGILGVGFATLWWDETKTITRAEILISTAISQADLPSVMLEEITQSLGFLHDIDGPAYEGVSILSQTSNATTTIEGQDAALLRWHYPPKD